MNYNKENIKESVKRLMKYIIMLLSVFIICVIITKSNKYEELLLIAFSSATSFAILDQVAPAIIIPKL
jgi:hypothetical protein